jgi:hypothetical protein
MKSGGGKRFLLIVPVLFFLASGVITSNAGPYYLGDNSDPDYPYLFNALNLLRLTSPMHTDHPGTTLQEFGAAVIFAKWSLASLGGHVPSLDEAVLSDPEAYLHAINLALKLLLTGVVILCACRIYSLSGSLAAAAVFEAAIWFHAQLAVAQTRVSPEHLLAAAACAFFLPFIPVLFGSGRAFAAQHPRTAYLAGTLFAFGAITKVTFLPLGALMLLLAGWRQMARFWVAFAGGTLVFTLPILRWLPRVGEWLFSILLHRASYGTGSVGLPTAEAFAGGLRLIYSTEPFLFVVPAYFLLLAACSVRLTMLKQALRFLLAASAAILLEIAVTAKHPAAQYIVPVLLLPALAAALLIATYVELKPRGLAAALILVLGGVILVCGMARSALAVSRWTETRNSYREEVRKIMLESRRGDCVTAGFYRSSLPVYALEFGNIWAGGAYTTLLQSLFPKALTFDIFSGHFSFFGREVPAGEIQQRLDAGECLLAEGNPQFGGLARLSESVKVTVVMAGSSESLYRLSSKGLRLELVPKLEVPAGAIVIEAEKFSAGVVVADTEGYGRGIGVITSAKYPAYAAYDIPVERAGQYQLWIRYASADSRPLKFIFNGAVTAGAACARPTGGFTPEYQLWTKAGAIEAKTGVNTLRLESSGPFPHIDKLALLP